MGEEKTKITEDESMFWADQVARKVIKERGEKDEYTVSSGVSPSGTVHIGTFREVITSDLIKRALESLGKKVKFIYSWDDFDRLRKVPENIPKKEDLKKEIGKPLAGISDPWDCHKSFAEHIEKDFEDNCRKANLKPEFQYQTKEYSSGNYAELIKVALLKKEKIIEILNKYRQEPLEKNWWPIEIYCEKCGKDFTEVLNYNEDYIIEYSCKCGNKNKIDFREKPIIKLLWRVDWPMRWAFYDVDFEPGGKDHSSPGGSSTTAFEIVKEIYKKEPPVYIMYDFIIAKGGGKMSKSIGNVIEFADVIKIYLPEIARFLFAGTRPQTEFSISMDEGVIKVYEDFYKVERIFYGEEEADEKKKMQMSRIYEMSVLEKPEKKIPYQLGFRTAVNTLNIFQSVEGALRYLSESQGLKQKSDLERCKKVLECAKEWLELYAPEDYKFKVQENVSGEIKGKLSKEQKNGMNILMQRLKEKDWSEEDLHQEFYKITESAGIASPELFKGIYLVLLAKEKGPRLAGFIKTLGPEKVIKLFEQI